MDEPRPAPVYQQAPDRALLDTVGLARRLGRTPEWFYRHKDELMDVHGFPPPVTGLGNRWDPVAIDRWLDRQLPEHLRLPTNPAELQKAEQDYWTQVLHERLNNPDKQPSPPSRRRRHGDPEKE